MDYNDYYVRWQVRQQLDEARRDARQRALVPAAPPLSTRLVTLMRERYARWSSAASTGSKPTTARA